MLLVKQCDSRPGSFQYKLKWQEDVSDYVSKIMDNFSHQK